jgi:hypothetical protein
MAAVLDGFKQEWRAFKASPPGARFVAHHHRAQEHSSRAGRIARAALGVVLFAAGLVMLVAPGPGLLFALFGLGLLATMSERLARRLDRLEARLRAGGRALRAWWDRRSLPAQLALAGTATLVVVVAAGYAAWRVFG